MLSHVLSRSLSASTNKNREDSWFKSLFVRKVDPRKDAHSQLLAKKEDTNLYKIQCRLSLTHTHSQGFSCDACESTLQ